ncbi:MAG: hypothetical protein K0R26_1936 [Bacteroidota bacterium]|jgi:hypothetical protein|nr:hypothetical protein [Bacteroidota bacterium]
MVFTNFQFITDNWRALLAFGGAAIAIYVTARFLFKTLDEAEKAEREQDDNIYPNH